MYFKSIGSVAIIMAGIVVGTQPAKALTCDTPSKTTYNSNPGYASPAEHLAKGFRIQADNGLGKPIVETKPGCLPLAIRYNNPGAIKTRQAGFWEGQIDKDGKGHAVFQTVQDGASAWALLIKGYVDERNLITAFQIMNRYAPDTDCVGSEGIPPDNCKHGLNPTEEYARRVAASVGKGPHDPLGLQAQDDPMALEDLQALVSALFSEIITFEVGGNFCAKRCIVEPEIVRAAIEKHWQDRYAEKMNLTYCMAQDHCTIMHDAKELTVTSFNPDGLDRLRSYWKAEKGLYVESLATPFVMIAHTQVNGLDGLSGKVQVDFTAPQAESSASPNCELPVVSVNGISAGTDELEVTDGDTLVVSIVCRPEVKTYGHANFSMAVVRDE